MPTLVPARPSCPESSFAATAPTGRVERNRRAHEDLGARQPPRRAHDLARNDQIDAGSSPRKHVARNRLTRRDAREVPYVSRESQIWFLWLILGLKMPLIGLFYFIFRVMRAQDKAWEQGEFDGGSSDEDSGGGGEPRIKPPPPPGGPGVRRRKPTAAGAAARRARTAVATRRRGARGAAAHPRSAAVARAHEPPETTLDGEHMRFLILGSGPAGYAAASTAAALGAEVTIVDRMALGGNWTMTDGIPSKTLLQVASSMAEIERAESRGIVFEHGRPQRRPAARRGARALHRPAPVARRARAARPDRGHDRLRPGRHRARRRARRDDRARPARDRVRPSARLHRRARRGSRRSPRSTTSASSTRATCSACTSCPSNCSSSAPARPAASSPSSSRAAARA